MKIQLKRSNVLEGGKAKEPTPGQMEYGELAVNYNESDPTIFLKDSNDQIIRISSPGLPDLGEGAEQPGTLDDRYVLNSGDTMTGALVLHADPASNLEAATKQYVDTEIDDLIPGTAISPTPPTNPVEGQLWWNSVDGTLYVYYIDADSSQWVPASPNTGSSVILETLETSKAKFSGMLSEKVVISASAANAGVPVDLAEGNVYYYTSSSNATYTPNVRYNNTTALNEILEVGETATLVVLSTNASSGVYLGGLKIDNVTQTVLWPNGEAPSEGTLGIDSYTFQIIKTADSAFTVLASANNFA